MVDGGIMSWFNLLAWQQKLAVGGIVLVVLGHNAAWLELCEKAGR